MHNYDAFSFEEQQIIMAAERVAAAAHGVADTFRSLKDDRDYLARVERARAVEVPDSTRDEVIRQGKESIRMREVSLATKREVFALEMEILSVYTRQAPARRA